MDHILPAFDRSDDIIYEGEALRFEREWEDGTLSLTRVRLQRQFRLEDGSPPTVEWFLTEFAEGRLRLKSTKLAPMKRPRKARVDISDKEYTSAARVQFVCQALDDAGCNKSNNAIDMVLSEVFTPEVIDRFGMPPPGSTARKWLNRSVRHERDLDRSASRGGQGKRTKRRDQEVQKLLTDAALYYWGRPTASIEDAHSEHVAWVADYNAKRVEDGLTPERPYGKTEVRQRINQLEKWETWASKHGAENASRRFRPNGRSPQSSRFCELGFIDHQIFDALVAIEEIGDEMIPVGRPTVTVCFDDYTECVVSAVLHLTPPSLYNMLDAIKQANRPKMKRTLVGAAHHELLSGIYCKFDTILPDNAREFTGRSGHDSLHDLGCHIDWARAGHAQDKHKGERFWLTLNLYLAKKLPGAIFKPEIMKALGYDPSKQKVVLASTLRDLLDEAVAFYHLNLNRGLNAQPARLWESQVRKYGPPPVIRDDTMIDQMMGMVTEKTLTTAGIELFKGLRYNEQPTTDSLLARLSPISAKGRARPARGSRRITVKVKYNPANLSSIHVYADGEYVTLECMDEEYARNLSQKHHEAVMEWAAKQNLAFNTPEQRCLARATLNRAILEAAPELAMRQRRKVAQFIETERTGGGTPYVPSAYSGYGTPHLPAVASRTDNGHLPTSFRGANSKRKKSPTRKSELALPPPQTGLDVNEVKPRREPTRPGGGDWSGL